MTEEEFQSEVLARFDKLDARLDRLETRVENLHTRLDTWVTTFNARMDSIDHRLDVKVDLRLNGVEQRLGILETIHRYHMVDIDRRLAKLENRP